MEHHFHDRYWKSVSFIDSQTAEALAWDGSATIRNLSAAEQAEQFTDFNGNSVGRNKVLTATITCNGWTAKEARF